jgi:hypothetical protein
VANDQNGTGVSGTGNLCGISGTTSDGFAVRATCLNDGWLFLGSRQNGTALEANFVVNAFGSLSIAGSASKPGGGSWSSSSDVRLKKNVRSLSGSLARLLALRGVSFEYIDPVSSHELAGERIGLIAQEVESVIPDWVSTDDRGYKRVTVRGFEALAVEALRELRAEQQNKIDVLGAENRDLRRRLERLESAMERRDADAGARSAPVPTEIISK